MCSDISVTITQTKVTVMFTLLSCTALVSVSEEVRSRCHLKHRFCSMHISESTSNDSIYGELSYPVTAQHLSGHHGALHHLTASANHGAPPPYNHVVALPYAAHHSVIPTVSLAHPAPTSAAVAGFASTGTSFVSTRACSQTHIELQSVMLFILP